MKRKKVDSGLERRFLIALITNKTFLSSASDMIDPSLLQAEHMQQIARWCVRYFKRHKEAPGRNIETVFHAWAEKERNEDKVEVIHDFLSSLSNEYKSQDINVPHLLDELGNYLTSRKVAKLNDDVAAYMLNGQTSEALDAITSFRSVDTGLGQGIDVLNDRAAWTRTFESPPEPIIVFPGDAGKFLNPGLTRDSLIAIQGSEKKGKTFTCIEMAIRALQSRKKVAFFQVGDLSESQIMMRIGARLSGRPLWPDACGDVRIPKRIKLVKDIDDQGKKIIRPVIKYVTQRIDRPINKQACRRAARKWLRAHGLPRNSPSLMLGVYPNSTINVAQIDTVLDRWQWELEFVPDVIIIDYADILAPEDPRKDARNQVNDTWKALRRLSQQRHALVIAPTQANAEAYDVHTQRMKNFSEDKRKNAHVTGILGLNQTEKEKEHQIMRLNWIALREHRFDPRRCLYIAQCVELGRAFCCGAL